MTSSLHAPASDTHLLRPGRAALAYRYVPPTGDAPTIVFLPGYGSDMTGSKATALFAHAATTGLGCLLFDYAGCGASEGAFADQTLDNWLDDTLVAIDATAGPLLLIGSSMGGWLMLRAALARPARVAAMIGIAAAPDFTEWDFSAEDRDTLRRDEQLLRPNPYGPEPTLFTRGLWESGQASLMLDTDIGFAGPVALLHGEADTDVPYPVAQRLSFALTTEDVELTLIKDGDHRLSRPRDIALLLATVDRMRERMHERMLP